MKQEQIIIIGVGIASMLFAYLLKGNIIEGIDDKPDYSQLLMVREQTYKLITAASLINENGKIPLKKREEAKDYVVSASKQLLEWYNNRVKGLTIPDKKTTIKELKKTWSQNKPLISSAVEEMDVIVEDQAMIVRLLNSVISNLDSIE